MPFRDVPLKWKLAEWPIRRGTMAIVSTILGSLAGLLACLLAMMTLDITAVQAVSIYIITGLAISLCVTVYAIVASENFNNALHDSRHPARCA